MTITNPAQHTFGFTQASRDWDCNLCQGFGYVLSDER